MGYVGDFRSGATVYIPFSSFSSDDPSASMTITGLAVTDIEIYKDGNTTQRASDAGYTLLDTDGIDFDGLTGLHGFSIDTSDNTTAGFFVAGHDFMIGVSSITLDAAVINFWAHFSVENRYSAGHIISTNIATLASQTSFTIAAGSANDNAYNGCTIIISDIASNVQRAVGYVSDYTGATKTITLVADPGIFTMAAGDNVSIIATSANANVRANSDKTGYSLAADQSAVTVGAVSGAVGSVTGNVGGNVTGSVGSVAGAVGSVTGNVGGNVTGSVGSVVGAVGSVTGAVGSVTAGVTVATNSDKTGYSLAADQSAVTVGAVSGAVGSVTGNVGGNVTGSVGSVAGAVGSVTGNVGGNVTGSVGSVVGHTNQTGDSFARLGAPAGVSVSADIAAIKALANYIPEGIEKNVAKNNFPFFMADETDGRTAETGLTVTARRSIDGGAFGACAGAVAEIGNGMYVIDLTQADTNGNEIIYRFSATGAADTFITVNTTAAA